MKGEMHAKHELQANVIELNNTRGAVESIKGGINTAGRSR